MLCIIPLSICGWIEPSSNNSRFLFRGVSSGKRCGKGLNGAETLFNAIESIFNIAKRYLAIIKTQFRPILTLFSAI
jgi:hypothetical protein